MVPTAPKYRQGPLVVPYISSMSHNSGGVTNLGKIFVSKFEKSPPYDDEGGVSSLNYTPDLMKPLIIMYMSLESCVTFMMNVKPCLGYPPTKIQSQKGDTPMMAQIKSTNMLNMLQLNQPPCIT